MLKASQNFFVFHIQSKEKHFTPKGLFKEKGKWRFEQKMKRLVFTVRTTVIKKDPTTSIRKHANEVKVHKKTVRTAIETRYKPRL